MVTQRGTRLTEDLAFRVYKVKGLGLGFRVWRIQGGAALHYIRALGIRIHLRKCSPRDDNGCYTVHVEVILKESRGIRNPEP